MTKSGYPLVNARRAGIDTPDIKATLPRGPPVFFANGKLGEAMGGRVGPKFILVWGEAGVASYANQTLLQNHRIPGVV